MKMDRIIDSDVSMAASNKFNSIVQHVQESCLNFHLQVTPFSAVIYLKKTMAKDSSGNPLQQASTYSELETLKSSLLDMTEKYEKLMMKYQAALESNDTLSSTLKNRDDTINSLQVANGAAKAAVDVIFHDYDKQVRSWKEELNVANMNHNKLLKKFKQIENEVIKETEEDNCVNASKIEFVQPAILINTCSICNEEIDNYATEYFCGEVIDSMCNKCKSEANLLDFEHFPRAFASFPEFEMSLSLVSHWIPPGTIHEISLLSLPSLRAHYVRLPSPGDYFLSMEEAMLHTRTFVGEQERKWNEGNERFVVECSICGLSFGSSGKLRDHDKLYQFCCRECSTCYRTAQESVHCCTEEGDS